MILDTGFLISVERDEDSARAFLNAAANRGTSLHTTEPVVAQVWRHGQQARLSQLLNSLTIHPLMDGREVGELIGRSRTSDVVDAHLVAVAHQFDIDILTGDIDDLAAVCASLGSGAPKIHPWPPK